MVFSSLPVNQFDSHNWQQQGNQVQQHLDRVTSTDQNPNFNLPQLTSPPTSQAGSSQPRVNSMVERARIAKVPLPEAALKCPRCDSTNTKFCYFNNYNLTQPRHFCKTCRRYWTRGGALRNVPVGGGFRRNKRSKSSGGRSKSTVVVSDDNNTTATTSLTSHPSYSNPSKFLSYGQIPGFSSNLTTLSPLQSLGDYNSSNIGLDFGGIQISNAMSGMNSSTGGILDPWRISSLQQAQQFSFLMNNNNTGLEQSSNVLYPLLQGNEGVNQAIPQQETSNYPNQLRSKPLMDMALSRDATQPINVKAEENDQDQNQDRDGSGVNNLSRNLLGNINMNSAGNNEYTTWGGNSSSTNSSWNGFNFNNSTGHLSF